MQEYGTASKPGQIKGKLSSLTHSRCTSTAIAGAMFSPEMSPCMTSCSCSCSVRNQSIAYLSVDYLGVNYNGFISLLLTINESNLPLTGVRPMDIFVLYACFMSHSDLMPYWHRRLAYYVRRMLTSYAGCSNPSPCCAMESCWRDTLELFHRASINAMASEL